MNNDKGAETLGFTLKLIVLAIIVMWAASFVPDQPWMFDQTPICKDANASLRLDGNVVRCTSP